MTKEQERYMREIQKAQAEYDALAREANEVMYELEGALSMSEKTRLRKKLDSISAKMKAADQKESEAKRKLDNC